MSGKNSWKRYKKYLYHNEKLGLTIDVSKMNFPNDFITKMTPLIDRAFKNMDALESGVIANPDENRMVGHYWLRNAALAPNKELTNEINSTLSAVKEFAKKVHNGEIVSPKSGKKFKNILIIGIGGSALGPQLVSFALGGASNPMTSYFFDNTDPDGMDYVLGQIGDSLSETLSVVISKSGGTKETRNGMLEAKAAYEAKGLNFAHHAVAVTGKDSDLEKVAIADKWIERFPMWDWVGGRTSETSAVGMLPAALQGLDIDTLLKGAAACDEVTRTKEPLKNPAMLLSLMWHYGSSGTGLKDMVILPYKDRLHLFAKYLQQLIMESLGKEKDLDGKVVNQGIAVYGNKGSTDQHAYIQQLRDGVSNFFVTFIEVLKDRAGTSMKVEDDFTTGDYLNAFYQGTRTALSGNARESVTITIEKLDAFSMGVLIALYERATGYYASLVNINAYHQPGVEAGKKAAGVVAKLQRTAFSHLRANTGKSYTADEVASSIGSPEDVETLFKLLLHAASNPDHNVKILKADTLTESQFKFIG
ncbi:glucose-6-phosphate isomerase [Candidatus Magnetomonas plexicatena]|uniref:glucose-6-phosphate isomerase n=1 Tax=Candidatus Magnetomonas plexicatena TaxID=2552947 RepID=UPI001C7834C9|nr:glucose-6-phosphate isomerase [Nitrospirales bacterium LBB_01]